MKKVLLGNEAIIQGALAAGVSFVSGYPGCPSAEIGDGFAKIAKDFGVYAEWSTNEKTGLEAAIGASFSGLKSLVNMKSFGINVCSDSLLPLAYTGTKAPMVIVVADDPSCWSSAQSEQDSRGYAYLAKIPVLEPTDPQDCYDFTKLAFEISEKFNIPVILRTTTRVAHQRAIVEFSPASQASISKGEFVKNVHQFSTMPPRTMEMKKELLEKIIKIQKYFEKLNINLIVNPLSPKASARQAGIIASGASYFHAKEAMGELGVDLPILKLGSFYPLPEKKINDFVKGLKNVLVAEEVDPYLEKEILRISKEASPKIKVFGKDVLPQIGELNSEKICVALGKILGKRFLPFKVKNLPLAKRTARLCPGCPYWNVFPALKRIAPEGTIFGGDIGCNMIGGLAPHSLHDFLFDMGASIGISHGIKKSTNQKVISLMGDGTFFHSGIAGMVNAVYNKSSPLMIVLDNRITAMTGHQQNPGTGKTSMQEPTEELKIEDIARACGVKHVKTVDPTNAQEFENTVKEFLGKEEISIIICKKICALLAKRLSI